MSIRRLLIIAFVSMSLLPSAALTFFAFSQARDALSAEIARNLESQAVSLMERIDWLLFERFENMRTWGQLDIMQETRINDLDKRISALLADLKTGHEVYSQIFCTTIDGQIVAASDPSLLGTFVSPQPTWLRFPLPSGAISLETFSFRPPFAKTALRMRMPLPDLFRQDQPDVHDAPTNTATQHGSIGLLYADFDWTEILHILDQVGVRGLQPAAQGRMAVLLDAEARLIAASSLVRKTSPPPRRNGSAARLRRQFRPLANAMQPSRSGVFLTNGHGLGHAAVLVGYGRSQGVQSFAGFGWSLFVLQPTSQAYRPVWEMGTVFFILLAITGVLAVGVSLLIAARIARPALALTEYTRQFVRGGASEPPPASSVAEIDELAQAYTQMMRDLEASREQLVRAAKLAVAGEMAAAMTHEIRTPLGILRSSAQMLQREPQLSTEGHEMAGFVLSETDRLNQLVSSLLSFARPRAPVFEPHDIQLIVQHTLHMLAPQAERKQIQVQEDFQAREATIACDEEQIIQVFLNLLLNAFQALPTGGQIEVRTYTEDEQLVIDVADTGPGVPPPLHQRIFEPFFTTRENGIGLGLTVVQQIVQAHSGNISVSDSQAGGACFRLQFPHVSFSQQERGAEA